VNSISNYVGHFFKIWLRDEDGYGLRLLQAETYYRSHFEIVSKCVMIATIAGVWYNCINQWLRNVRRVFIYKDFTDMMLRGFDVPGIAIGITLIVIPFWTVIFRKVCRKQIGEQGFEIDLEVDKEEIMQD
jgi:hypothetical protein